MLQESCDTEAGPCEVCSLHKHLPHSRQSGLGAVSRGEEQPVGMQLSSCQPCSLEMQPTCWIAGLRRRSTSQDFLGLQEAEIAKRGLVIIGPPDCRVPHFPVAATRWWLWPLLLESALALALASPPFLLKNPQCTPLGKPRGVV